MRNGFYGLVSLFVLVPAVSFGFWIDLAGRSTAHFDLVKHSALCAGFSTDESNTIANYSQAADLPTGFNDVKLDFVDHAGANAAYFHAPQLVSGVDALNELLKWARGEVKVPAGLPFVTPQVSELSGTLGAFGIYLHALGDKYSHGACIDSGYVPHCTERPGTIAGEGTFFTKCSNIKEHAFCHYVHSHENEFGKNQVLTSYTKTGLVEVYKALTLKKTGIASIPSAIESTIFLFANTQDPQQRAVVAASLCQ